MCIRNLIWICLLTLFSILCGQSHQYCITFNFVSFSLFFSSSLSSFSPLLDRVSCSAFCLFHVQYRVYSSFASCFLSSLHFLDPMEETNIPDLFHQFLDAFSTFFHAVLWIPHSSLSLRVSHCHRIWFVVRRTSQNGQSGMSVVSGSGIIPSWGGIWLLVPA
jgi:hypothetical protein